MYRSYYGDVTKVEEEGERGVRFHLQVGRQPRIAADPRADAGIVEEVLGRPGFREDDARAAARQRPLQDRIARRRPLDHLPPGRRITGAANLPVSKGRHNVDTIRYDYYRDGTIALEAFKAGQYDVRRENSSKSWATGYDSPAMRAGLIKKEEIKNQMPSGMQGFAYNLRRPLFQDPRVRKALAYAFDFEWSNKNLFYGAYKRTRSYFDNSELAATGVPQGAELKILEKFRGKVPDEVFTTDYNPPKYDGSGNIRDGLRDGAQAVEGGGLELQGREAASTTRPASLSNSRS